MPATKTPAQSPADMMDAGKQLMNDPDHYRDNLTRRLIHQSLYHPSSPLPHLNALLRLRPDLLPTPPPPVNFHADLRARLIQIAAHGLPGHAMLAIDHLATYFPDALPPPHHAPDTD